MAAADGRMAHFSEDNRANIYLILKFFLPRLPFGHIIEFGSFRGGSALFMAAVCAEILPGRKILALDTFTGMPATDKRVDAHNEGDFSNTSLDDVQSAVEHQGLGHIIQLVPGLFEDTAAQALAETGPIALAHIDCDIKSGCNLARHVIRPHMVQGGYIVFDDATISSCLGATEAVEEMIHESGVFSEQIWPQYVFRHGLRDSEAD
jgi:predicted O-methyltransferase YrrM